MSNFSFIKFNTHSKMYENAYNIITKMNMWNHLRDFNSDKGFMFSDKDEKMKNLINEIATKYEGGHSGSSLGVTMHVMHYIAKYGLEKFRVKYLSELNDN